MNVLTTYRTMGRAPIGERARMSSYFQRGDRYYIYLNMCFLLETDDLCRYSVLPALTMDGILYVHVTQGSFDGNLFQEFLTGLLEVMNPYPQKNSVLVMDNCAIHHVDGVAEMCKTR